MDIYALDQRVRDKYHRLLPKPIRFVLQPVVWCGQVALCIAALPFVGLVYAGLLIYEAWKKYT